MIFGIKQFLLKVIAFLQTVRFGIFNLFISKQVTSTAKNSLLLVVLDEIGDYVLMRNFFKVLRESEQYKNYSITMLGNKAWKPLFEYYDAQYFDDAVWIDKKRFINFCPYRYKFLQALRERHFEKAINTSVSRGYLIDDAVLLFANAKEKIGADSDISKSYAWQLRKSDTYYTTLFQKPLDEVFQFEKNRAFFSELHNTDIQIQKPSIEPIPKTSITLPEKPYAVFYCGARNSYKRWSVNNFAAIAEYLQEKYSYPILLIGARNDIDANSAFMELLNEDVALTDLTNKTNLTDIIAIIANAEILVTNDSVSVHIAAATDTKALVPVNGTHFGRFLPYPDEYKTSITAVYPPVIKSRFSDFEVITKEYRYRSALNINDISVDDIKQKVDLLLS